MTDDEMRRGRKRVVHKIPVSSGAPAGPFDREAVVANRAFGVASNAVSAILKVLTAADLSRGTAAHQPGRHPLAVIAHDAVEHLYVNEHVPQARIDELRRFMFARYENYAPGCELRADPLNRWDGRFEARDLVAPHPWTIQDLRGAAWDFLAVEAFEFFRDPASSDRVRVAASLVVGSLAAIGPDGTNRALLEGVAGTPPREDEPLSIATHAWLREIRTGTHGGDLGALAREGHRLLSVVASVAAARGLVAVKEPKPLKPPSRADEMAWTLHTHLWKNQTEAARIMSEETKSRWDQSRVSRACDRVNKYRAAGGHVEGLPDPPQAAGRRRMRPTDPRSVEAGRGTMGERPKEADDPNDGDPMQS